MFGKLIDAVTDTVEEFVDDPIGTTINKATQPLRDGVEVIEGLTEGEIRLFAATRLGADVVSGMALSEILEWAATLADE